MKVTVSNVVNISTLDLAKALADASPEEFAAFWFHFHEVTQKYKIDLDALGRAMTHELGGNRKEPLRTIVHAMEAEIYRMKHAPKMPLGGGGGD